MESRAYAFAAGVFTLLLGASLVFIAMWLTGETESRHTFVLESRYPVTGLSPQASVRFRGVDVGKVEAIDIDPKDSRVILIRVAVRTGTPVTRGTYAQLGTQGVTGIAHVTLDDDGSNPERLAADTDGANRIPVRQSFLDGLLASGQDLVADANRVARRLNGLLSDENQAQFVRTLASLESAADRIDKLAVQADPAVRNLPALTEDARKVLARADAALASVNDVTLQLATGLGALDRVATSTEQMGGAAVSLSSAAENDTLPRLNSLLEQLARNSRRLDRLLAELEEQPASFLFGRPVPAPGPGEPGFTVQQRGEQ
ncbi:MAG: MlaD family protein [Betaproteobacteria bacterium]|nr:MlaD family protein [Betaproteobacteria bacterium]MDH3437406.1 MlaD family protein [Betaproteobacteria bacterium]